MTTIFIVAVLAFLISLAATWLAIRLAPWIGLADHPDGYRKIHERPTLRFGGPVIFLAFFAPLIILAWNYQRTEVAQQLFIRTRDLTGLFVGCALALVLGLIDDKYQLRARWKLIFQILIGVVICFFGYAIDGITNPFSSKILYLGIFAWPITVLWVVACMNAVNLADGMDGLAAGICLFVSLTLFVLSVELTNVFGSLAMACLAGAVLGFLVFNFPPARIFLGDSGSMLLGFMIADCPSLTPCWPLFDAGIESSPSRLLTASISTTSWCPGD